LRQARLADLSGLETLIGIPAAVGGAVTMNAGTREGQTFDRLVSVRVVDGDGRILDRPRAELSPSYRDGGLGDQVVLAATFELVEEPKAKIWERTEQWLKLRNSTQPVAEPSLGCIFKNPTADCPAGRLIDQCGLKGQQVGGIEVSTKHANYFVNKGGGTTRDVLVLMALVKERVREQFEIELVPEVRMWGL
jgi:UDP-N-acetylmuramate dehydrogenase